MEEILSKESFKNQIIIINDETGEPTMFTVSEYLDNYLIIRLIKRNICQMCQKEKQTNKLLNEIIIISLYLLPKNLYQF